MQLRFIYLILLSPFQLMAEPVTNHNVSFADVLKLEVSTQATTIQYGELPQQIGELWLPLLSGQHPMVMLIHGGCWLNQFDLTHIRPLAARLQAAGIIVWSIEYRRLGDDGGGYPGTFDDVRLATDKFQLLKIDLENKGYAINNTYAIGHSAGGHLALWAGAVTKSFDQIIGLAAIADLATYAEGDSNCEQAALSLMGESPEDNPAIYQVSSPIELDYHPRQVILFSGGRDMIVPISQAEAFINIHSDTSLQFFEDAGHFDFIHPDSMAAAHLVRVMQP